MINERLLKKAGLKSELKQEFPLMPRHHVEACAKQFSINKNLSHLLKEEDHSIDRQVAAYVRHALTCYDDLLKTHSQKQARSMVSRHVKKIMGSWRNYER